MSASVILIANPKGGAGKSTLATNLAGLLANRRGGYGGVQVMLGDVDRQQSSRVWLASRPDSVARICGWDWTPGSPARPPQGTTHIVLDTPAGLHGDKLKELLRQTTSVLVPVQPSVFDIEATRVFLDSLAEKKAARGLSVALVGMRVDARTRSAEMLTRFVESSGLPLLTCLRDTQNYVQLAARGLTLFDMPPSRVEKDLMQWRAIETWLFPY
ncbi:MAG: ParA family protein [Uliginosibacterium sp.]|nr:ParA family protein [Uliginosibacterium sp.]